MSETIQELLLDRQFRRYRRAELSLGVNYVQDRLFRDDISPEELKGGLDMLRRIIKLPLDFTLAEVSREKVEQAIQEDLNWLNVQFVKDSIEPILTGGSRDQGEKS